MKITVIPSRELLKGSMVSHSRLRQQLHLSPLLNVDIFHHEGLQVSLQSLYICCGGPVILTGGLHHKSQQITAKTQLTKSNKAAHLRDYRRSGVKGLETVKCLTDNGRNSFHSNHVLLKMQSNYLNSLRMEIL